jgi:hypothetical protein
MLLLAALLLGTPLACDDKKSSDKSEEAEDDDKNDDEDDESAKKKKKKKKKKSDDDEASDDDGDSDGDDDEEPKEVQGKAPATGGKSKVPTIAEWNAVTKEVTVKGSSKLNCETKMVREWLRVSCRGKNHTGGEPTGVTVVSGGGRGEDFAFTGSGVSSLVVRFVEGVDLKARFSWSDRSHTLRVWWPRGAPEPPPKGEFTPRP